MLQLREDPLVVFSTEKLELNDSEEAHGLTSIISVDSVASALELADSVGLLDAVGVGCLSLR